MTSSPSDPGPLGLSSGTTLSTSGKSGTEAGETAAYVLRYMVYHEA